jgi:hypothetical protein
VGTIKRGKGTKLMALADASGLPLGVHATSASPHEVTLVELIGDRAYDSDPLDEALEERGIEIIAPYRSNRKRPQDPGRPQTQTLQEALENRAPLCLAG